MTLAEILLKHLQDRPGQWIKKGHLYVVAEDAGYSPETGARELRRLAEEDSIQVEYYKGQRNQNLAKYCYHKIKPLKRVVKLVDGRAVETFE